MKLANTLDHTDAQRAVTAIELSLKARGKAAVIAVADSHGELVSLLRVGDAPLASLTIAMNKAYTAAREGRPSGDIGRASRDPSGGFDIAYFGDPRVVGWDGGLPVRISGQLVGSVAVSGLSGAEDVALAEVGIGAILAFDAAV